MNNTNILKIQSGGFLGNIFGPLAKICLPLMKNVLITLAKYVLILLGLTTVASGTDAAALQKKIRGSSEYVQVQVLDSQH